MVHNTGRSTVGGVVMSFTGGPQVTKPFTVDVTGPYRGGTCESYTATVSSDKPRSVTFFLYSGSLSSRAFGKRAVIADRAMPASSRASGPPKQ